MSIQAHLEGKVEEVLASTSVTRAQRIMQSRSGTVILAAISFFESALPVPILTDPFLVAAVLLNRAKAMQLVFVTMCASVLGGVMAYLMAAFFLDTILGFLTPDMVRQFETMVSSTEGSTFMLTILGAVTPVPYTIIAWVIAVIEGSLLIFIVASILGRGVRYSIIGYCVYRFGPLATKYAKRYIGITSIIIVLLVAAFVWLKM